MASSCGRKGTLSRRTRRKAATEPEIHWREYPLIEAREYSAYCRWAKIYRDPGFHRWTCLMKWDVLADELVTVIATVPYWLSIGSKDKPHASKRSKYLHVWVRANGAPPTRGDRLSPRIFVGRISRVEIGDTDPQKSPVPYSVVKRIVQWETGGLSGSISHQITQSRSAEDKASRKKAIQGMSGMF